MSNDAPATSPAPTPRVRVLPARTGFIVRDEVAGQDYPFNRLKSAVFAAEQITGNLPLGLLGSPTAINYYNVNPDAPDLL